MKQHEQFLMNPPGFEPAIQKSIVELGYAILPNFFTDEEMARMQLWSDFVWKQRTVLSPTSSDNYRGTLTTSTDRDTKFRRSIYGALLPDVEVATKRVTDGYRIISTGFITKEPGIGEIEMHQDSSITQDEEKIQCLTIWVPLVDVDIKNGGLAVTPCSHLLNRRPRALFSKFFGSGHEEELLSKYSRQIDLKAGDAIIFDRCLIHDSGVNETNVNRDAMQIILTPTHVPSYWHVFKEVEGKRYLDCYGVPDSFFHQQVLTTKPDPALYVGTIPAVSVPLDLEWLGELQKKSSILI